MRFTLILLEVTQFRLEMSDVNERLREKTMQITILNQKMESLQAQLGGAQRRATQLTEQVATLETALAQKDSEIQALAANLSKTKGALDAVAKQMQGVRAEQTESLAKKRMDTGGNASKEELLKAEKTIARLKDDIRKLSEAATDVLLQKEGAIEGLSEMVKTVGDVNHKIFNLVLERRSLKIDEIASTLLIETAEVLDAVDSLQTLGELQFKDSNTVIPAKKYREVRVPVEEWKSMRPAEIFDSLEEVIAKAEGKETIVEALEKSVDLLEQKIARGGALIFQMRKTSESWKRQEGDVEELRYTIRDWKSRAVTLQ
jgi:chromosome segregation ATPase